MLSSSGVYTRNFDSAKPGEAQFLHRGAVEPVFFLPLLLRQYTAGRYPCGWDGVMIRQDWAGSAVADLPRGRVRVL